MRFLPLTLLAFAVASAAPVVQVAYPPSDHRLSFTRTILEGHTSPGASLSIDGKPVQVGPDGLFMEWWPLKPGLNTLNLVATQGGECTVQTLRLSVEVPRSLPMRPSAVRPDSLSPSRQVILYGASSDPATQQIRVRFQASPGGRASVQVGSRQRLSLSEEPASPTQAAGWYSGTVNLATLPAGELTDVPVQFTFTGRDGKTLKATAPGRISREAAPRVAVVIAADMGQGVNPASTSFDTGPQARDQLFPRQGERVVVWRKDSQGVTVQGVAGPALAPDATLSLLPAGTPLPAPQVGTAQLSDTTTEWQVRWPLSERVLFDTTEGQDPVSTRATLNLTLAQGAGSSELMSLPTLPDAPAVRWNGTGLSVTLPQQQLWGYWTGYEGSDLVLHIRKAPALNPAQPLAGRIILIDPGHGGDEFGGAGALGTPEKNIVLPIAQRVAALLRAQGADARLTRDSDQKVPLYNRPLLAEQLQADMLISIHANALPDGIDPRTHHGLEVHTYHPMTYSLARQLLSSIPAAVPGLMISSSGTERDPALSSGLMVSNLALTRPSTQRSLLIELAYLTDPTELRLLMSAAGQAAFAQGVAAGIAADYAAQVSR